jgi:5'(3')-deoxyribonucleotidase
VTPTVLLDCDGILTNYAAMTAKVLNSIQSRRVFLEEDITSWEASTFAAPGAERNRYWDICKAPGFVKQLPPDVAAQRAVNDLHKVAEVVVVTSYLKGAHTWTHERDQWLRCHFGIEPSHVIHTRAKVHVLGDVFVDDALKNVVPWGKRRAGHALLWDKPYNRELGEETGCYRRIHSWDAVFETVERVRRGR